MNLTQLSQHASSDGYLSLLHITNKNIICILRNFYIPLCVYMFTDLQEMYVYVLHTCFLNLYDYCLGLKTKLCWSKSETLPTIRHEWRNWSSRIGTDSLFMWLHTINFSDCDWSFNPIDTDSLFMWLHTVNYLFIWLHTINSLFSLV